VPTRACARSSGHTWTTAFELPEVTNTGEPSPHIVASSAFLGRVLVLNFMRSHCVNCEREKADVRAFAEHLDAREAAILSIMTDQVEGFPPTDSAATLSRSGFTHPVLMADQPFIDALHGSTWSHVTPITYFVDRQGTVVESLRGAQTEETLQAALQRTLEAN